MAKPRKKEKPHGDQTNWERTGGAIGDLTMKEVDDYNRAGAGVDKDLEINSVEDMGGDPNADVHLLRETKDGSEMGP